MTNESVILRNTSKCPFVSGQEFSGVNNSLSSTPSEDEKKLLWTPEIKPISLRNYQTGQTMQVKGPLPDMYSDCRHHVCTSTLMSLSAHAHNSKSTNDNTIDELESHSPGYIKKEAYDYQSIYSKDKNIPEIDYQQRLEEIYIELRNTGTYTHTTDEIEYGCQLAWRNASRCINRLFWRSLNVIDRRHVKTNDEMFKEICNHMRLAYNKGTLQATTLVMNSQARLWSTQYLRYACYEQPDGSLLGDPMNKNLTKAAMDLGWNKPENERTQWDLLPIIVQIDPNQPPSLYELPKDLRYEVFLSHPDPKYDAVIKKLGLRWVAQPYVCDKAIEIGGIFYRCVPFSGWFMQTEIGRNLCDIQRYNFIPKIADLLNLDITAPANSQMNVDRIYIEINAAVLYSFEKAKIGIVDHHTAATGFMKFLQQEINQRGNTPADWVWLVPPISGGMSSVFHQEMFNYVLKPRVLDQRDPWTYYAPFIKHEKTLAITTKSKRRNRWLLVRAACCCIGCALKAIKRRISVSVLYASASGTAQSYAEQMSKKLMNDGYNAKLMELDSFPFDKPTETRSIIFIITSTFGQGNAPEGGQKVENWLQNETNVATNNSNDSMKRNSYLNSHYEINQTKKSPLHWCSYAVCATGSSAYPFFCGFGKLVDTTFQLLGANRLAPLATCDALNHQYKSYNEWEENTIMALKKAYPHASSRKENISSSSKIRPTFEKQVSYVEKQVNLNTSTRPRFIPLTFNSDAFKDVKIKQDGPFTKENPFIATVLQNIELTGANDDAKESSVQQFQHPRSLSPDDDKSRRKKVSIPPNFDVVSKDEHRSVRLITFDTTGLTHYPGDHVCILPENTLANVNGVILACGWQLRNKLLNEPCSLESFTNGKYQTLREILTNFVDLTTTLRPHILNTLATYATDLNEQRKILELGKGGQRYADWLINSPTVKETLDMFQSIKIPLEELIQLLPQLQPRYYSISSSNRFHPNQIHITVSVVTYLTPRGVTRKGVCSHYLRQTLPKLDDDGKIIQATWQRKASQVRMFISPNPHFRLPGQEDLSLTITPDMITGGDAYLPLSSPLLMFAVGSGIAPFRSFWQELQVLEGLQGSVQVERVLFMGCRTSSDFLYAKELEKLTSKTDRNEKLFKAVIPVYSRENTVTKRYIQDFMLDYEDMIYSLLTHEDAFVYMCGSTRSCQGIESTLASILQSCSEYDLTSTQAKNRIKEYKEQGRIKQDMFG